MRALTRVDVPTRARRAMWCATFDPSRPDVVFACGADGTCRRARAVGVHAWREVETMGGRRDRAARFCAVSPCGRALAVASFDGVVTVFRRERAMGGEDLVGDEEDFGTRDAGETERWRRTCAIEGHESEVKSCGWSPSGSLLATCGRDRTVWVWEAHGEEEFECAAAMHGHGGDVKRVTWHPTEDVLVTTSYDESVKIWREDADGDDWSCVRTLGGEDGNGGEGHASTVWCASFEPRALDDGRVGTRCVTCGGDGKLIVWNGKGFCNTDLEFGTSFECGHDRAVLSCSWGRNGLVAAGGGDNSIRLYGEVDGTWREVVKVENAHDDDVNHVEWSPHDSSLLVSASDDGTVTIWRLS
ncbi:putative WD40 protein Ciao1 [Ostreococcus tauri]|nr:putative WD40 protein Ciao1 [Ostreococcus tauri]